LRLQTTDRSCKSVEQAHDFISANETHFAPVGAANWQSRRNQRAI
jgi:hypothetical protein